MSAEQRPKEFQFDLSGGHLALDFANSISRRDSPEKTVEHLNTPHELITFARQTGLVSADQAQALDRWSGSHSRAAMQALREAIAVREATFRAFFSLANGKPAPQRDVELLDETVREALRHRHMVREDGSYHWRWDDDLNPGRVLWPIAQSATELLTSHDLKQVRECEASDCYWLFLDNSRNRSRRWCSMTSCGNREKARRHYHRQHSR